LIISYLYQFIFLYPNLITHKDCASTFEKFTLCTKLQAVANILIFLNINI